MNAQRLLKAVATFVVAVVLVVGAVHAADPKRELWQHGAGSFVKVKGGKWEERDVNNKATFKFTETSRNDKYVELFDKSRKTTLRLTDKAANIREEKDTKFSKLYEGGWKD